MFGNKAQCRAEFPILSTTGNRLGSPKFPFSPLLPRWQPPPRCKAELVFPFFSMSSPPFLSALPLPSPKGTLPRVCFFRKRVFGKKKGGDVPSSSSRYTHWIPGEIHGLTRTHPTKNTRSCRGKSRKTKSSVNTSTPESFSVTPRSPGLALKFPAPHKSSLNSSRGHLDGIFLSPNGMRQPRVNKSERSTYEIRCCHKVLLK